MRIEQYLPKDKLLSLVRRLQNYVSEFGVEVFSIDGKVIYSEFRDVK